MRSRPRRQRQGYTVIAPANPLRGVTADAAYTASLLGQIDGPVLLAGHSYGGAVRPDGQTSIEFAINPALLWLG